MGKATQLANIHWWLKYIMCILLCTNKLPLNPPQNYISWGNPWLIIPIAAIHNAKKELVTTIVKEWDDLGEALDYHIP